MRPGDRVSGRIAESVRRWLALAFVLVLQTQLAAAARETGLRTLDDVPSAQARHMAGCVQPGAPQAPSAPCHDSQCCALATNGGAPLDRALIVVIFCLAPLDAIRAALSPPERSAALPGSSRREAVGAPRAPPVAG